MRFLLVFLMASVLFGQTKIAHFDDRLYVQNKLSLDKILEATVLNLLESENLAGSASNTRKVSSLLFLQQLLTSNSPSDGNQAGILQIPYFWHWCTPNPRHSMTYLPTGKKLSNEKPPSLYQNYKSYADIDRPPFLYLSDLFEDTPKYSHPQVGVFYTFGWCSEREMAFGQLMTLKGYVTKVYQEGPHVWSEVLITLHSSTGKPITCVVKVDNTYDVFDVKKLTRSVEVWKKDFGAGSMVKWYNKKATGVSEKTRVTTIEVSEERMQQLDKAVKKWIVLFQ